MSETPAPVAEDTPIWRYMDLPKFVSILATRSLWFTKVARFRDDLYEGLSYAIPFGTSSDHDAPKLVTHSDSQGTRQISLAEMRADMSQRTAAEFERARERLYVNSWCLAEESMAMWQIYGASGHGIALRSTVGQYQQAARFNVREEQYTFRSVKYHSDLAACRETMLDLRQGSIPLPGPGLWEKMLELAFLKRTCFKYEQEWRAVLYQDHRDVAGCSVDFDLDKLIDAVYVGPRAEQLVVDTVDFLMDKFELRKPLARSVLLSPPPAGMASGSAA